MAYDLKTEKALKSKDMSQAELYLSHAFKHGATIRRYFHEIELHKYMGESQRLQSAFDEAFAKYPDSILLQKLEK